jgi:hypothetical protein
MVVPRLRRGDASSWPDETKPPLTGEKPVTPVDDDVSPYLRQPLRTLAKARQDRKRRRREIADAEAKARQPA